MFDLGTFATFAVYNHIFLNTRSPKKTYSEARLQHEKWNPVTIATFTASIRPLYLAAQNCKPIYATCIICEVNYIDLKFELVLKPKHILRAMFHDCSSKTTRLRNYLTFLNHSWTISRNLSESCTVRLRMVDIGITTLSNGLQITSFIFN